MFGIVLTIFICKKYGIDLIVRSTKKGIAKAYEISYAISAVLNSAMTFLAKQQQNKFVYLFDSFSKYDSSYQPDQI